MFKKKLFVLTSEILMHWKSAFIKLLVLTYRFIKTFLLLLLTLFVYDDYYYRFILLRNWISIRFLANMSGVKKFTATKECSIGGLQMNGGTVENAKITNKG